MKKVLNGHVSQETAFEVQDYPYGFTLRCKMRWWIETASKGAKKNQQRVMSQTSNPKKGDIWNKPSAGTYSNMVLLYLDDEGHVQNDGLMYYQGPDKYSQWRGDYYDQMDEPTKRRFNAMEKVSRTVNPESWANLRWID